jgi:hypothetical protein
MQDQPSSVSVCAPAKQTNVFSAEKRLRRGIECLILNLKRDVASIERLVLNVECLIQSIKRGISSVE